ncbi:hypothetical protein [Caballeronia glathei]|uniref:hypothetical protein n=1 Tax=Caballeronia glathei TaxID=60547 RepID=UPI001377B554|nr:hypothetical protein [Caballeronia glathei]
MAYTRDDGMMSPVQLASIMLDAAIACVGHYSSRDEYKGFRKTAVGFEVTSSSRKR